VEVTLDACTIVTVTADQPIGLALVETYMRAQTVDITGARWVVVDDGLEAATLTMGQQHIRRTREANCRPAQSFCRNLLAALPQIRGEWAIFLEHDDYYGPRHLETILGLMARKDARIAGDGLQRYYNVKERCWHPFNNFGACFCQTALHVKHLPLLKRLVEGHLSADYYGVDAKLWRHVPRREWAVESVGTALGIKGLPGRAGLGLGHRPTADWKRDPELETLRTWIGADAERYAPFYAPSAALPLVRPRRP
jgi:glycosyl transferase family 2